MNRSAALQWPTTPATEPLAGYRIGAAAEGDSPAVPGDRQELRVHWRARQRLNDAQWNRIQDALPGRVGARALNGGNARRFMEAVLWMAQTRAYWSDVPREFGNWHTIYIRFGRWCSDGGIWPAVIAAMGEDMADVREALHQLVDKYQASNQARRLRRTLDSAAK